MLYVERFLIILELRSRRYVEGKWDAHVHVLLIVFGATLAYYKTELNAALFDYAVELIGCSVILLVLLLKEKKDVSVFRIVNEDPVYTIKKDDKLGDRVPISEVHSICITRNILNRWSIIIYGFNNKLLHSYSVNRNAYISINKVESSGITIV